MAARHDYDYPGGGKQSIYALAIGYLSGVMYMTWLSLDKFVGIYVTLVLNPTPNPDRLGNFSECRKTWT